VCAARKVFDEGDAVRGRAVITAGTATKSADDAEAPRKRGWPRRGRLVCANQGEVAPGAGGRRSFVDGGTCGGDGRQHSEEGEPGSKSKGDEDYEVRRSTRSMPVFSGWSEEAHGGRNRRRSSADRAGNRRFWRHLRAPGLDSFHRVNEESEADLMVCSDREGGARSGGAMARPTVVLGLHREKEGKQERWRREGGRR
jgi:hypothetical protein